MNLRDSMDMTPTEKLVERARQWRAQLNHPRMREISVITYETDHLDTKLPRDNTRCTVGGYDVNDILDKLAGLLGELATDLETVNRKSKLTESAVRRMLLNELLQGPKHEQES